jgi:hypothetical protein
MSQQWKTESADDDVQMPLGTGDAGGGEESYAAPRQKVNTSTLALFAAFAAGLIVLYLLGLQNKPRAASAEDQAKQAAVASAIEEMLSKNSQSGAQVRSFLNDTGKLLELIRHYLEPRDDGFDLPGNPFERDQPRAVAAAPGEPPPIIPADDNEARILRETAEEFAKLKLQSVIIGARPAALITGKMVTVGAKFGHLAVTDIQAGRVLLSDGKRTFELKVNAPAMDKP